MLSWRQHVSTQDPELSKPAILDLRSLFPGVDIDWIEECGLAATISKAEVECLGERAQLAVLLKGCAEAATYLVAFGSPRCGAEKLTCAG